MAQPSPQPDKSHGADPRTVTHAEARTNGNWWKVTLASQVS